MRPLSCHSSSSNVGTIKTKICSALCRLFKVIQRGEVLVHRPLDVFCFATSNVDGCVFQSLRSVGGSIGTVLVFTSSEQSYKLFYYTLESLSQFWLVTSTQLIPAGCVSVTSYLQTIVLSMQKWRYLTRQTAVWAILSWRRRHQGLPRYQQKIWTSFLMIKM